MISSYCDVHLADNLVLGSAYFVVDSILSLESILSFSVFDSSISIMKVLKT